MKSIIFFSLLIFGLLTVSAINICVDLDRPSPPGNLTVSGDVGNIKLEWLPATDTPLCSGIKEYRVNRDGVLLGVVGPNTLSFIDNETLSDGEYNYTVFAVDKVGNNEGQAIKNTVKINGGGVTTSSGGGGSSSVCTERWECQEWFECFDGQENRSCNDLNDCGTSINEPETSRLCSDDSNTNNDNGVLFSSNLQSTDFDNNIEENRGFFSLITGGVISGDVIAETLGENGIAIGIFLLIAILLFVLFIILRKKR